MLLNELESKSICRPHGYYNIALNLLAITPSSPSIKFSAKFNYAYTSAVYSWLDSALIPEEYLFCDEQILGLPTFLLQGRHLGLMGLATAQMLNATGTNITKSITNFFILSFKDQYISYWLKARVVQIPKRGNPGPTPLHHSSLLPSSSPSLTILSLPYYLPELMCPNWGNTTLPPHWVNTICVTQSHKSASFITMQEAYFLN